jgi:ABC-type transport system substrate-binding protein
MEQKGTNVTKVRRPLMNGTRLVPCAARSWSASPDQRIYTLQLRPGVKFSNEREVVADDYVYAMERILNPINAAMMQGYLLGIRGAKAFGAGETNGGYDYNPAKARELLRESRLSLPLRTQLWHSTHEHSRIQAQGFQWDLQQVGIEVELKAVAFAETNGGRFDTRQGANDVDRVALHTGSHRHTRYAVRWPRRHQRSHDELFVLQQSRSQSTS